MYTNLNGLMNRIYYMSVMQNTHGSKIIKNTPDLWKKNFPWKRELEHKYSRGRVVIYGGQKEFKFAFLNTSFIHISAE